MPPQKLLSANSTLLRARRKKLFAPVSACITASLATPAMALSLGAATTHGYIGTPLRIEIPILADPADDLDVACVHLASSAQNYSDDIPWLTRGKLSIETGTGGRKLVIVASPVQQPAVRLGLRAECGVNLRRDYAILLDLPPLREIQSHAEIPANNAGFVPVQARPPVQPAPEEKQAGSGNWQVQTGDTAANIAARLLPGHRAAQRRLAQTILSRNAANLPSGIRTNQDLPEGVQIDLPPLPPVQSTAPDSGEPAVRPQKKNPQDTPLRRRTEGATSALASNPHRHDVVIISGGPDLPLRLSTTLGAYGTPPAGGSPPSEEQLIADLDEKTATQIELKEKLRQLEAMQAGLREQSAQVEAQLRKYGGEASGPTAAPAVRIPPPVSRPVIHPGKTEIKAPAEVFPWTALLAAGGALILLAIGGLVFWFRRSREARYERLGGDTLPMPVPPALAEQDGEPLGAPLSEADIWPDHAGRAPTIGEHARSSGATNLGQFTASGLGPASMLHVIEHDVEEHDSAIELAEIMLSFGRVQGAAQTLADYIRNNPKQAVRPWLKLLEVYRAGEMRTEFDALVQQLHRNFNVKPVEWEKFEVTRQASDTLESLPHIMEKLEELWRTRECQAFLHKLLRDNREGMRQGFPLAIIDEILLLLAIQEQELGPYRPGDAELPVPPATAPDPATYRQEYAAQDAAPPATQPGELPPLILPTASFTRSGRFPSIPAPDLEPTQSFLNLDFELDIEDASKTQSLDIEGLPTETPAGSETAQKQG